MLLLLLLLYPRCLSTLAPLLPDYSSQPLLIIADAHAAAAAKSPTIRLSKGRANARARFPKLGSGTKGRFNVTSAFGLENRGCFCLCSRPPRPDSFKGQSLTTNIPSLCKIYSQGPLDAKGKEALCSLWTQCKHSFPAAGLPGDIPRRDGACFPPSPKFPLIQPLCSRKQRKRRRGDSTIRQRVCGR